jgi:hypothetical protein
MQSLAWTVFAPAICKSCTSQRHPPPARMTATMKQSYRQSCQHHFAMILTNHSTWSIEHINSTGRRRPHKIPFKFLQRVTNKLRHCRKMCSHTRHGIIVSDTARKATTSYTTTGGRHPKDTHENASTPSLMSDLRCCETTQGATRGPRYNGPRYS